VGRLDGDTSGLLLFTNDGWLAHRLMHPRFEIPKTYEVTLTLPPTPKALEQLGGGVEFIRGEVSRPATVHVERSMGEVTVISLTLSEGRNRQVRRMCESLGLEILALKRVSVGPIDLGDLAQGRLRRLRRGEISALKRLVEDSSAQKRATSRRG
jgi:pseudouridine synthase